MLRPGLAISALAAGLSAQQLPERQLQLREQRELEQRANEQRRQLIREQRERDEHQHEDELLLIRRRNEAEGDRVRQAQASEMQSPPTPEQKPVAEVLPATSLPQPSLDFSPPLLARALGAGLLAGACALLLGKLVQRRFRLDT